jgi:hypothetical protein
MLLHFFLIAAQSFKDFLPSIVRLPISRTIQDAYSSASNHELFHLDDLPPPVALLPLGIPCYPRFRLEFRSIQGFRLACHRSYPPIRRRNSHVDHHREHWRPIYRCLLLDHGCLFRSQHPGLLGDSIGPKSPTQGRSISFVHSALC